MSRYGLTLRVLATFCVVALYWTGVLHPLRDDIGDARFRFLPRSPSHNVVLVEIDAKSLAAKGTWPWSRAIHGQIVDRLREAGAASVAFDVDFSAASTPDGDAALAAALGRMNGMASLAVLQQSASTRGDGSLLVNRPIPALAAAAWEASVDVVPDSDGIIRSVARGELFDGSPVSSLPVVLAGQGDSRDGSFLIDFGIDVREIDHISAIDLLENRVAPDRIRGKTALIGATAIELRDFYQTPRYGVLSGATLEIVAAESLIQGRALQPVPRAWPIMICILLCAAAWAARRMTMSLFILVCGGSAALLEICATVVQGLWPYVLDTSPAHVETLAMAVLAVLIEIDSRGVKILVSRGNASRLRLLLDHVIADSFAGVIVVDHDGGVRAVSRAARIMLGIDEAADVAHDLERRLPKPLLTALDDARRRAQADHWSTEPPREAECVLQPGTPPSILEFVTTVSQVPGAVADNRVKAGSEFAICLTFQDVTEQRRAQADIARLAHFDSLTGLANRHSFLPRVHAALASGDGHRGCLAVLSFDLDRFKLVNDRLGHGCGDALLRCVADRIRTVEQDGDLAARLGGDEFALLIERHDLGGVEKAAEQLAARLSGTYEIGPYQITVAISVGVALGDGVDAAVLLKQADAALYAAKAAGGDRVRLYDNALERTAEAALQLEQDLREAIRNREFEVVYQRQVDVRDETITGVEALVRWRHPVRGYIAPDEFIPIAERTGSIEAIGAWVLQTACCEAVTWPRPIKVSVNLSAVQLSRGDILETVSGALAGSGLPPSRLDLELTESILMDNTGFARGMLDRIRELGVGLSLDDFGTGYSSLAYLKTFDIDKVKIDRSFVRDLPEDQSSIAIIRAVVTLAQTLGLRVNTEGVETAEQFAMLRAIGCDEVQGFLHGRPEPSGAIAASLQNEVNATLRMAG